MSLAQDQNYQYDQKTKIKYFNPTNDHLLTVFREKYPELATKYSIKRRKFALTKTQREELLDIALQKKYQYYLMIRLQLETGCRVGEIANLVFNDLFLSQNPPFLKIQRHNKTTKHEFWEPKTQAGVRTIYLDKNLASLVKNHLSERRKAEKHNREKNYSPLLDYVFISRKNTPFSERHIRRFVNTCARACKSIGENIGTHTLRRTYASFHFKYGRDPATLSNDLGHKSVRTTLDYVFQIEDTEEKQRGAKISAKMHTIKGKKIIQKMKQEYQRDYEVLQRKIARNQITQQNRPNVPERLTCLHCNYEALRTEFVQKRIPGSSIEITNCPQCKVTCEYFDTKSKERMFLCESCQDLIPERKLNKLPLPSENKRIYFCNDCRVPVHETTFTRHHKGR